eukprot:gnl/TRDRNA2_/TRDRNA2_190164_c0_seq1.p1 gnl/TRDRNA2_/TRDRNA2_190164_c0~~gnl/TRDRNA2_/TRDRNA2_190164_c0_seq1.p1  ORF type:complete len:463 (+),score=50.53 gnl/TRDRNA2_/TRDRNA2_190164_c0_seq1:183-1571(+)
MSKNNDSAVVGEEDPLLFSKGRKQGSNSCTTSSIDSATPSKCRFLSMTCFTFPMAVIWSTTGLVILPAEALRLFPRDESLYLGIFLLVVGISQLICPIAGLASDRCRSRWGKRRPFIVIGCSLAILCFAGMWFSSVIMLGWLYIVWLFLCQLALNIIYAAQASIVPDFYKTGKGEVSGIVAVLQFSGNLFGMLYILSSAESDFHLTYLLYMILLMLAAVLVVWAVGERSTADDPSNPITWEALRRSYWIDLEGDRDFFWVFVGRTLYYMATSCQTFLFYYLRDLLLVESQAVIRWRLGMLALIACGTALCVSLPLGSMSDKVGRKPFIYFATGSMSMVYIGYLLCPLAGPDKGMIWVYVLGGAYGIGSGCYLSVDYALALDCLPEKAKGSSEALGLWGISGFLGSALGPMIGGLLLEFLSPYGEPEAEHAHYTYPGYIGMLAMGSCCFIMSGISTIFIKKAK